MNENQQLNWRDYYVTIIIFIINVVAYILCTQMGEVVYNIGSVDAESVLLKGECYRMLSAMFLHADIEHIVSNMIFLVGLGQMVETTIGHFRFGIIYILSGLVGSICSVMHSVISAEIYSSVGASGAIFGIIGALLVLVLINGGNFKTVSIKRLILAVVYMIYSGLNAQRIDNAAHIGGFIGGVFIMAFINFIHVFRKGRI